MSRVLQFLFLDSGYDFPSFTSRFVILSIHIFSIYRYIHNSTFTVLISYISLYHKIVLTTQFSLIVKLLKSLPHNVLFICIKIDAGFSTLVLICREHLCVYYPLLSNVCILSYFEQCVYY